MSDNIIRSFFTLNYNIKNDIVDIKQLEQYTILVTFDNEVSVKFKFNPVIERFEILEVINWAK
jgi:hypothetical protein